MAFDWFHNSIDRKIKKNLFSHDCDYVHAHTTTLYHIRYSLFKTSINLCVSRMLQPINYLLCTVSVCPQWIVNWLCLINEKCTKIFVGATTSFLLCDSIVLRMWKISFFSTSDKLWQLCCCFLFSTHTNSLSLSMYGCNFFLFSSIPLVDDFCYFGVFPYTITTVNFILFDDTFTSFSVSFRLPVIRLSLSHASHTIMSGNWMEKLNEKIEWSRYSSFEIK